MTEPTLKLDAFLPYRLSVASNAVSSVIAQAYDRLFGLKVPEWRLVAVLGEHDRLTQQAIVKRTRMDKVTVNRAASALTARGLIQRVPNAQDGRSHLLQLTKDGLDLYRRVAPAALTMEAAILDGFTADEITTLERLLHRLETAAARIAEQR